MKKILTLISFLFNIVFALAQTTNYYAVTKTFNEQGYTCLLYTSPSPRDRQKSRMPSSA